MTRLLGAIVYNWPLKLMAIALATLLYAALVIAQNAQSRDVSVPIDAANKQPDTILIGDLGEVTNIQYFVADQTNVTITSANFSASVDLSQVQPSPQAQSVRVVVVSADPRVQVLSATPDYVSVKLEKVGTKVVRVDVLPGTPPDGLEIDPPTQSLTEATIRGAQSDIARVAAVRAVVPIDTSGLDIDRDFALRPVDVLGDPVPGVDVEPASVRVTIFVYENRTTANVPIVPTIVGNLAAGYEVVRVTVSASVVSVQGDANDLANVANARTQPISLEGRTTDLDTTIGFDLPQGVSAVAPLNVQVHVVVRAITESRTFRAGIVLAGTRPDRTYDLSVEQALVTIGGSPVDLDNLVGATLNLSGNVADLGVGAHQVPLTITVQAGLSVVAITPATVTVTIGEASAGSPSAAPSASG
jgi:YbbR domain-containing protein